MFSPAVPNPAAVAEGHEDDVYHTKMLAACSPLSRTPEQILLGINSPVTLPMVLRVWGGSLFEVLRWSLIT